MIAGTLFCFNRSGMKVKVGEAIEYTTSPKKWLFKKSKPHLMRIIGPKGGYGIQRKVFSAGDVEIDLMEEFRKKPEMIIYIKDVDNGKEYISQGKDWSEHYHKGNYGDGSQVFLGINYMKQIKTSAGLNQEELFSNLEGGD